MAQFTAVSSAIRFTLNLGEVDGKVSTKSVSVSKIGTEATAAALEAVSAAFGALLAYPVTAVKRYDTDLLESEQGSLQVGEFVKARRGQLWPSARLEFLMTGGEFIEDYKTDFCD